MYGNGLRHTVSAYYANLRGLVSTDAPMLSKKRGKRCIDRRLRRGLRGYDWQLMSVSRGAGIMQLVTLATGVSGNSKQSAEMASACNGGVRLSIECVARSSSNVTRRKPMQYDSGAPAPLQLARQLSCNNSSVAPSSVGNGGIYIGVW